MTQNPSGTPTPETHDADTQSDTNSGGAPEQPDENVTSGDSSGGN